MEEEKDFTFKTYEKAYFHINNGGYTYTLFSVKESPDSEKTFHLSIVSSSFGMEQEIILPLNGVLVDYLIEAFTSFLEVNKEELFDNKNYLNTLLKPTIEISKGKKIN